MKITLLAASLLLALDLAVRAVPVAASDCPWVPPDVPRYIPPPAPVIEVPTFDGWLRDRD